MLSVAAAKTVPVVLRYSEATVPTAYGAVRMVVYRETETAVEHVALVRGDVDGGDDVLTRVHSECFTSEVFHSLKCDCREQLGPRATADRQSRMRCCDLFAVRKVAALGWATRSKPTPLQEQGLDTVDANRSLGFDDDQREYAVACEMIRDLGIRSVALMTNNPLKIDALKRVVALRSAGASLITLRPTNIAVRT